MTDQLVPQMSQIQGVVLKRVIAMLEGLKCPYAIIDPLGSKHGLLEVKMPVVRTKNPKYPHGERSKYCRKFLEKMAIGDVAVIPVGKYDVISIQAASISCANRIWESGSVTTTLNREKQLVEILRIK